MKQSKIERIAIRAYEIWEQEGRPPGRAEEHWRRAEQDVAAAMNTAQMGEHGTGTRPAPPREAAPPLSQAMAPPGEASPRLARRKTATPRKRSGSQQG